MVVIATRARDWPHDETCTEIPPSQEISASWHIVVLPGGSHASIRLQHFFQMPDDIHSHNAASLRQMAVLEEYIYSHVSMGLLQ
jgi:hypothetical protein